MRQCQGSKFAPGGEGGLILLRYIETGELVILPGDDPRRVVDAMVETNYNMEFCLALGFNPEFIASLMAAGFLVMSTAIAPLNDDTSEKPPIDKPTEYILLPKLHIVRSALFFENLHIKKSIRRHLPRYELRVDDSFEFILDHCVETHGGEWLTPPLVEAIKAIRNEGDICGVHPMSFALYRDGKLVAGEFGTKVGNVYTSYSGYHDEANAGTVQLILAAQYLRDNGFAFFDLGMPLDYKTDLGAVDISTGEFVKLWRAGTEVP